MCLHPISFHPNIYPYWTCTVTWPCWRIYMFHPFWYRNCLESIKNVLIAMLFFQKCALNIFFVYCAYISFELTHSISFVPMIWAILLKFVHEFHSGKLLRQSKKLPIGENNVHILFIDKPRRKLENVEVWHMEYLHITWNLNRKTILFYRNEP